MYEMHCRAKVVLNRLHFHSLYFDAPRIGGFVQTGLHDVRYGFSLGEDFGQVLGAQYIA